MKPEPKDKSGPELHRQIAENLCRAYSKVPEGEMPDRLRELLGAIRARESGGDDASR